MVLIAPGTPVDRLGGVVDAVDFVARLKAQSPRIIVLWLRAEGSPALARMGTVDGVVVRPDQSRIRAAGSESEATALADEFARQLRLDGSVAGGSAAARVISPDALRRLRDTTKALTAASTRGEVLPLVIAFAAEEFARVALFMVRDGKAVGMAQRGLDRCGGPDDAALRELDYPCEDSPWITEMLERGKPSQGEPATEGDRAFVRLLGDRLPDEAYLAPIESTGRVIALLYVDNLPDGAPIEDTNALEVVLHHTGLALDRAALERALHEDAD
jgi:hypothetical protein